MMRQDTVVVMIALGTRTMTYEAFPSYYIG